MNTLQALLHSTGLARVSTEIAHVVLPSIRFNAQPIDETQIKLGATKLGGAQISQEYEWPQHNGLPLPFVAQIDLTDLVSYDTEHILLEIGRLYFFFDVDAFFKSWPRNPATWRVWYDRSPLSVLQRPVIPEAISKRRRYRSCEVGYALELTLPDYSRYNSTSLQRLGLSQPLTDEEEQAYYEIQAQLAGRAGARRHIPLHRLLGHPDDVQWDMHSDLEGEASDWLLLLQVDSDGAPDMDWGDTGRMYFWIRKSDLAASDFSQIRLILQST